MVLRGVIIVGLATIALAACGGGSDDQKDAKTASGAAGVKKGGVLRIGTTDQITSFNPFLALTLQTGVAIGMTHPQLVQLDYKDGKGYTVVPDFASSWKTSSDGAAITFKVRPNAQWSDGKPLTANDAAWTINTIVKFREGPTGQQASFVEGVRKAEAPDATTVVVRYDKARANALILLASGLPILPEHMWAQHAKGEGRGLRTFRPEAREVVSGGPFLLKSHEKRGTTAFVPNPKFYGPASNAEAVALTFYTNKDSMLEELSAGRLDMVESVPPSAVKTVKRNRSVTVQANDSALQADLFFNANPRKPKHRELLDPRVRSALAQCIDRKQVVDVIFNGYAKPVDTLVGSLGGEFQNPELGPRPYDCDEANRMLDELGYKRGSDGIRVVPAAKDDGEHKMAYEVVTVGQASVYNVDRTVEILRKGWEQIGVKVTQKVAGDETATWDYITGGNDCDPKTSKGYTSWDMDVSYSVAEVDPISTLSGELKETWCAWNFTGSDDPEYDELYKQASTELDAARRKQVLWTMQELYYERAATAPLAEQQDISAYSKKWTGFAPPEVAGYSKRYYTAPHQM